MPPDTQKALQLYATWLRKVNKQAQQDCVFALAQKKAQWQGQEENSVFLTSVQPHAVSSGTRDITVALEASVTGF